ncbi:MAG: hypothetical protein IJF26_05870 [Clostridia bacterium]|nr:hypothetical protein [Clostridia bacterium]
MIKPEKQFFLFGMGHREKTVYIDGKLKTVFKNSVLYSWDVEKEEFLFDEYKVILTLKDGSVVEIYENCEGVYVNDTCIASSKLNLPTLEGYKYQKHLRILHHEILISFNENNEPVPNIYVYNKPWYRDGAMMALVLEKTGNIELLRKWATSITELYDKNNWGMSEPDNLGQLAYVLSYFFDKDYPLVNEIIKEAKRISRDGCLTGITDGNDHTVYSTLWLKYGLSKLNADTSFINVPKKFDSYARMFWMDRSDVERETYFENKYDKLYPYLTWAVMHFENEEIDKELLDIQYPMTWEIEASQAKYEKIAPLSENYAKGKCGAPHSWHAAEMFMYLIEFKD